MNSMDVNMTNARDLYLRHIDKNGHKTVQLHRVWDAERFLTAQEAAAKKEGGKSRIEVITRETYQQERAK